MKKRKSKIIPIMIVLVLLLSLAACVKTDPPPGEDNTKPEEQPFYDLSELNFSSDYYNPDAPDEKGFVWGDAIDFNKIKYNISYKKSPMFHVYYEDAPLSIAFVEKALGATLYSDYRFESTGKYTFLIVVPQATNSASARVTFKVRACGIPERTLFKVQDSEGNLVSEIFKGKTYTVTAEIHSDGKKMDIAANDQYEVNWEEKTPGAVFTFTPQETGEKIYTFYYSYTRNGGESYKGKAEFSFDAK